VSAKGALVHKLFHFTISPTKTGGLFQGRRGQKPPRAGSVYFDRQALLKANVPILLDRKNLREV